LLGSYGSRDSYHAEAICGELSRHGDTITAIAVQQAWRATVERGILPVENSDWNHDTIVSGNLETLAYIVVRVVARRNLLDLAHLLGALDNVIIENALGRARRAETNPEIRRVVLEISVGPAMVAASYIGHSKRMAVRRWASNPTVSHFPINFHLTIFISLFSSHY